MDYALGYNADIICLQEVDKKVFERDLLPTMRQLNIAGMLYCKAGKIAEGEAIFFRKSKFR